jgi:septum formation protein
MKKIILASSSPRRRKILSEMGLEFEVIPSNYEEFLESLVFSYEKIETLAYNKAKDVANRLNGSEIVLAADTVVVLDGRILGKPKDENDAFLMLESLSGKKHSVVTSICAIEVKNEKCEILSSTSYVEFKPLDKSLIKNYIKNFKPLDKAGSYGIQELPEGFTASIEGSFENIIGLCPKAVKKVLKYFD